MQVGARVRERYLAGSGDLAGTSRYWKGTRGKLGKEAAIETPSSCHLGGKEAEPEPEPLSP